MPKGDGLTPEQRLWSRVRESESGCLEWTGYVAPNGYGRITVNGRTTTTHRAAWMFANGPIPDGSHICHTCDNKVCVNPDHLFLGDALSNMKDKVAKGRQAVGTRNGNGRISDETVRAIREGYVQLFHTLAVGNATRWRSNLKELSREYGVSYSHVYKIVRGECRNVTSIGGSLA